MLTYLRFDDGGARGIFCTPLLLELVRVIDTVLGLVHEGAEESTKVDVLCVVLPVRTPLSPSEFLNSEVETLHTVP